MNTNQQKGEMVKILITGGGTGGHITPLLAVASEIKKLSPDSQITYVGTKSDISSHIVSECPSIDKRYKILAGKLRRYHGKSPMWYLAQPKIIFFNIRDAIYTFIGLLQSFKILLLDKPDVVFVKGGFVGLPVGLMAALFKLPIITHDSDSHPGLTNRTLSRYASILAVGAPVDAYPQYKGKNLVYTGVPVRNSFYNAPSYLSAKTILDINDDQRVISVIGGSSGASKLNEAILVLYEPLLTMYSDICLLWVTGKVQYGEILNKVQKSIVNNRVKLWDFHTNPELIMSASDIVITRAGATAIAELALLAKPAIVVPNPLLTGGHQLKNAQILQQRGAAFVVSDIDLQKTPDILEEKLVTLLEKPKTAQQLADNLAKLSVPNASTEIAKLIIGCVKA